MSLEYVNFGALTMSGTPTDGVDAIWTLDLTGVPEGGDFTISFRSEESDPIAFNATDAELQAALEAMTTIGARNVVVASATPGQLPDVQMIITFQRALGGVDIVDDLTADGSGLTGGTTPDAEVVEDTEGVRGSFRGVGPLSFVSDTDAQILYQNTGTSWAPVWAEAEAF